MPLVIADRKNLAISAILAISTPLAISASSTPLSSRAHSRDPGAAICDDADTLRISVPPLPGALFCF
jgi:hypothetical protein